MEKIADDYFRFLENRCPTEGVSVHMTIDRIDGVDLDTAVSLRGKFAIAGYQREEFCKRLGELIDEFRI